MGSAGIPPLDFTKPDGSQLSRYEMDVQTREKWHKVHWLRLMAIQQYGLPKQISYDMREIVLRQWVLDEMIRRGQISGVVLGVNAQSHNDEAEMRQFTQKLAAFVQANQIVLPKEGEGIDMSQFTPPPPPMMGAPVPQNGQAPAPAFSPPPMPPGGFPAAPGAPVAAPPMAQPQYTAPPGFAPAPGPVAPPAMPPGIPQGFPQQPSFPPQAAPVAAPPAPPGPPAAPQPAAAPGGGRKRGPKPADAAPAPVPGASPVPPMPGPMGPPAGFAPGPGVPGIPSAPGFVPAAPAPAPVPQGIATSPGVDLTPVLQRLDQLQATVNAQAAELKNASMVITFLARVVLQKQGSVEAAELLREFGHTPR